MTDTADFLAHYPKGYGRYAKTPDLTKCAGSVFKGNWEGSMQCTRKNGHGPDGAFCKQHDPVGAKAKSEARMAAWHEELDAKKRKYVFTGDCEAAILKIAAGHNDPRGLAISIIEKSKGNAK